MILDDREVFIRLIGTEPENIRVDHAYWCDTGELLTEQEIMRLDPDELYIEWCNDMVEYYDYA